MNDEERITLQIDNLSTLIEAISGRLWREIGKFEQWGRSKPNEWIGFNTLHSLTFNNVI